MDGRKYYTLRPLASKAVHEFHEFTRVDPQLT